MIIDLGKKSDQRADLVAITKRARELGGSITPKDVCRDLINRPEALAASERILQRCAYLGLLDAQYMLTEAGQKAAEEESVFLPENGVYRVWFTNDLLVAQGFIQYDPRSDGSLYEDVQGKSQPNRESVAPTPDWVDDLCGEELTNYGGEDIVKIESVEKKCRPVSNHGLHVMATLIAVQYQPTRIVLSSPKWRGNTTIDIPDLTFDDIWNELLTRHSLRWEAEFLEVLFNNIANGERHSFKTAITFDLPEIERYGAFDRTTVDEVPIAPQTKKDAQEWARFLLEDRIKEYLTTERYQTLVGQIEELPGFYKHAAVLDLPTKATFAKQIYDDNGPGNIRFWFLIAPLDLYPLEVE